MAQYTICNSLGKAVETFATDESGEAEQTLACWLVAHGNYATQFKMYRDDMERYEWTAWFKNPTGKKGTTVIIRDRFVGIDTFYKVSGDLAEAIAVDSARSAGRVLIGCDDFGTQSDEFRTALAVLDNRGIFPVFS